MTTEEVTSDREVTIYEHGDYQGRSQKLSPGKYNIGDLMIGNDRLSSLKIPEGMRVKLYEHANFMGSEKMFDADVPWVGNDFNDKTSSIIIETIGVVIPSYAKWMEYNFDKIKDKKLRQFCFPGTHDSGAYHLEKELAPDAADTISTCWKFRVNGATGIDDYIRGQAICQDKTIYEQLQNGIRYIDLRVCWKNNEFYTCHALLGNPIHILLNDIKRFLDENQKEIVIVKIGFKEMDSESKNKAEILFTELLGNYYHKEDFQGNSTFKQQIETGKRAIFHIGDFRYNNYNEDATTNGKVLEKLFELNSETKVFEAQFNRPVSDENYALGYIQKYGCRLLPFLTPLCAMPIIGPVLGAAGATAVPEFILYLRNCSPVPTDLKEHARDSRSIIRDYFYELDKNPSIQRPTLTICDFFEEVPLVDIAIRISTDQRFVDLLGDIHDINPICSTDRFLSDCPASAIAAAFKVAGYCADETAKFIKDTIPNVTGEILAVALKGAGYGLNEVGNALKEVGYGIDTIASALRKAGYNVAEAAKFMKDFIPNVTGEILAVALKNAGYGLNEVGNALKEVGYGIDIIASALRRAGYNVAETAKFIKDFIPGVTSDVVAVALKNAGYGLEETGRALNDLYNLGPEVLNEVLKRAGYAGKDIGNFFKSMGGEFEKFGKKLIDSLNPSKWG